MEIDSIILKARGGDKAAESLAYVRFTGGIISVCSKVFRAFGSKIPMKDLQDEAKSIFFDMIYKGYTVGGKARFPYYFKKMLFARLIHEFRPIYRGKRYDVPIENHRKQLRIKPDIWKKERVNIIYKLLKYAENNFTKRECAFINDCMIGGIHKNVLAERYGITTTRATQIYKRVSEKLVDKLSKMGVKKGDL